MHIVLVHGAGGSATSWSLVAPMLRERGLAVSVADNPSQSLEEDVARVTELVEGADDDVLLVGHSYGGAVITNVGRHPRVKGLVFVAAWVPDEGESVNEMVESYPEAEVAKYFSRGADGSWIPDRSPAARAALAWDVPDEVWASREEDRRTSGDAIFTQRTGTPAWRQLPSWYLVALQDKHIRLEAQRDMAARAGSTVREISTSHAVPHAAPQAVVDVIAEALAAVDS